MWEETLLTTFVEHIGTINSSALRSLILDAGRFRWNSVLKKATRTRLRDSIVRAVQDAETLPKCDIKVRTYLPAFARGCEAIFDVRNLCTSFESARNVLLEGAVGIAGYELTEVEYMIHLALQYWRRTERREAR